jgi:hypothetical protein
MTSIRRFRSIREEEAPVTNSADGDTAGNTEEAAKRKQKQFMMLVAVLSVCTVIFIVMMVLLAYTLPNATG